MCWTSNTDKLLIEFLHVFNPQVYFIVLLLLSKGSLSLPQVFWKYCTAARRWNREAKNYAREKCMFHEQFKSNKIYAIASLSVVRQWMTCHAREIYTINGWLCLDLLDSPRQRGSKCSCLLNESWQQRRRWLSNWLFLPDTQWPDWTWGISCTSSLHQDTKGHEINFLGHHYPQHACAHSPIGEINSCSFHLFFKHSTDYDYLRV